MIVLLAAAVFSSTGPSAANLADRFLRVQQSAPTEQPTPGYEGWTRNQLLAERDRLDLSRPSIVLPIVGVAVGGGLLIVSGITALYAGLFAFLGGIIGRGSGIDTGVVIFCAILAVIGAAGVVAGLIFLLPTLKERTAIGKQIDRVNDALEHLETDPGVPPPPPPPSVGNQVSRPSTWITVTLARF